MAGRAQEWGGPGGQGDKQEECGFPAGCRTPQSKPGTPLWRAGEEAGWQGQRRGHSRCLSSRGAVWVVEEMASLGHGAKVRGLPPRPPWMWRERTGFGFCRHRPCPGQIWAAVQGLGWTVGSARDSSSLPRRGGRLPAPGRVTQDASFPLVSCGADQQLGSGQLLSGAC